MTTKELNAFVNQQHLRGMSDRAIAGSLGLTLERLYFLKFPSVSNAYAVFESVKPKPEANFWVQK